MSSGFGVHGPRVTAVAAVWLVLAVVQALVVVAPSAAQDTLRLGALQAAAVERDPRLRRAALEAEATDLQLRNLAALRLPSLALTGEATVQSEVASLPLSVPGVEVPEPPDDRYELAVNAEWLLYDGGVTAARRAAARGELEATRAELAAELYPLRMEVLEAYFSALLLQERWLEAAALAEDLEARLAEVRQQAIAGAALPGDTAAVLAERLRVSQQQDELAADHRAALHVLSELTGRRVSPGSILVPPSLGATVSRARAMGATGAGDASIAGHPGLVALAARRDQLALEAAAVRARQMPQLSAFGRLGWGRPGLRQFTDELHEYWLTGVRLRWVPWDWGSTGREAAVLGLRGEMLEAEAAALGDRLRRQVRRPLEAMDRLPGDLERDDRIIELREQVERQARAQLAERAITPAQYVGVRTDLQEARIARALHAAELARAQAEYLTILGIVVPEQESQP